ncbi:hypothetical protein ACIQXV_10295 [Neobacillus sp. NPDC097160]|uniref:hypothetical protein n=1 Tax=Neobacillus sp. NPDC097160 TaxID=3364298 RepID=UPI00382D6350
MTHQQVMDKRTYGQLYNFMEYKKMRPFFVKPIKITMGNPINETYYLVKNVVYKGKQILVMKQKKDSKTIMLVEAEIKDGKLIHVSMVSEEVLVEVSGMLEKII